MTVIALTDAELRLAEFMGKSRAAVSRGTNTTDAKRGPQDGIDGDILGMKAELAVARFFGVYPDLSISARSGSADGVTRLGYRYDVKATHRLQGQLLCTTKDNPDIDFYILALVLGDQVNLVGWAWKRELRRDENLIDLGYGPTYALPQASLSPFGKPPCQTS